MNKPKALTLELEYKAQLEKLAYDEKPGIQASATTGEDLPPSEEHGCIKRDHEYRRLGTVSLLAGIDLQTGEAVPLVSESHTSKDYIDEINETPVGYHWTWHLDDIDASESVVTETFSKSVAI